MFANVVCCYRQRAEALLEFFSGFVIQIALKYFTVAGIGLAEMENTILPFTTKIDFKKSNDRKHHSIYLQRYTKIH